MNLFFDCETTGLPERGLSPNHPRQPHLVQLACLLCEDDGTERASVSLIVRPPVSIPDDVAAIHGITNGVAAAAGISPASAVAMWSNLARRADVLVAHNVGFDMAIMLTAWHRTQGEDAAAKWASAHGDRPLFCTMKAATPVVNLPPTERMIAAGMRQPKAPKLAECIRHFFGEELAGAHDALVDVRACARLYFHLQRMERAAA